LRDVIAALEDRVATMQSEAENLNKIVCAKTVEIAKFKIKQKKKAKPPKTTHDQCVQTPSSYF